MPTVSPQHAEDSYRPIAGLAIAGLIVSGVFALGITVGAIVGLVKGVPLLLPWLLVIPGAGAVLSFLAQRQIRNSEGTRAGLTLARSGLWLSVIFGLGYAAYVMATILAVRQQAEDFLLDKENGFFAKLKANETNAAFLLTRLPDQREGLVPSDDEKMLRQFGPQLMSFRNHALVRFVRQGAKETQVKLEGIGNSTYQEGGYWVELEFNIETPDVTVPYTLIARSRETTTGRKWYLDWTRVPEQARDVRMAGGRGEVVMDLRQDSHRVAQGWLQKLTNSRGKAGHKLAELIKFNEKRIPSEKTRVQIRRWLSDADAVDRPAFHVNFICCQFSTQGGATPKAPVLAYYSVDNNQLQITHEVEISYIRLAEGRPKPILICHAQIVVERTDPGLLKKPKRGKPKWEVRAMNIEQAIDPAKERARR
jgi:hypothetical protein